MGFRRRVASGKGLRPEDLAVLGLFRDMTDGLCQAATTESLEFSFEPGRVRAGNFSASLERGAPVMPLLQAAGLVMATASRETRLTLYGGTHVPGGPIFEAVDSTWRHVSGLAGMSLSIRLKWAGFGPQKNGEVSAQCSGPVAFKPVTLEVRPALRAIQIKSAAASLPAHLQQRQASRARAALRVAGIEPTVQLLKLPAASRGCSVAITGLFGEMPITVASIGERGKSVEAIGEDAAAHFRRFLGSDAVLPPGQVGALIPLLAMAQGSSSMTTSRLLASDTVAATLVGLFLDRTVRVEGKVGKPGRVVIE